MYFDFLYELQFNFYDGLFQVSATTGVDVVVVVLGACWVLFFFLLVKRRSKDEINVQQREMIGRPRTQQRTVLIERNKATFKKAGRKMKGCGEGVTTVRFSVLRRPKVHREG